MRVCSMFDGFVWVYGFCSGVKQGKVGTVLCIETSTANNGAVIVPFSQYPGEEETVWNACSFLQHRPGKDEVKLTAEGGMVRLFHVLVSANSKACTVEELEARRQKVIQQLLDEMHRDVGEWLDATTKKREFRARVRQDKAPAFQNHFLNSIRHESAKLKHKYFHKPAGWFKSRAHFGQAVDDGLALGRLARGKFSVWFNDKSLDLRDDMDKVSFEKAYGLTIASCHRLLQQAIAIGDANSIAKLALDYCVAKCLIKDVDSLELQDGAGKTPLVSKCCLGNVEDTRLLLQARANPDAMTGDREGKTVLHFSAEEGCVEIVLLLLEFHAHVNLETKHGKRILDMFIHDFKEEEGAGGGGQEEKARREREGRGEGKKIKSEAGGVVEEERGIGAPLRTDTCQIQIKQALLQAGARHSILFSVNTWNMDALRVCVAKGDKVEIIDDDNDYVGKRHRKRHRTCLIHALRKMCEEDARGSSWRFRRSTLWITFLDVLIAACVDASADVLVSSRILDSLDQGQTALMLASSLGLVPTVVKLLAEGATPELTDDSNCTSLMIAVIAKDEAIAEVLLAPTARAVGLETQHSGKEDRGKTALMLASSLGLVSTVEKLLAHGAKPELTDACNCTSLMIAVIAKDEATAEMLVAPTARAGGLEKRFTFHRRKDEPSPSDAQIRHEGKTALMLACEEGLVATVEKLLVHGAMPEITDQNGDVQESAILLAKSARVVECILSAGISLPQIAHFAQDLKNDLLLQFVRMACVPLVESLLRAGADPLYTRQTKRGTIDVCQICLRHTRHDASIKIACLALLYEHGAEVSLQTAAEHGAAGVVAAHITNGAVVDARDSSHRTALMLASRTGMVDVVKMLIDQGAKPELKDKNNCTSLIFAVSHEHEAAAGVLIAPTAQAGALDVQSTTGTTALMHASSAGLSDTVDKMLQHGAKPEMIHRCGMTALILACARGHDVVARMLVAPTCASGALNVRSSAFTGSVGHGGYSALTWAEEQGLTSVVQLLLESGATYLGSPPLALLCGDWEHDWEERLEVLENTGTVTVTKERTMTLPRDCSMAWRSKQRCPLGRKGYYEIEIVKLGAGAAPQQMTENEREAVYWMRQMEAMARQEDAEGEEDMETEEEEEQEEKGPETTACYGFVSVLSHAASLSLHSDLAIQECEARTQEKGVRKEPLPLGKVYVSRSTGKASRHHEDSNETRWTKAGIIIRPSDDANDSQTNVLECFCIDVGGTFKEELRRCFEAIHQPSTSNLMQVVRNVDIYRYIQQILCSSFEDAGVLCLKTISRVVNATLAQKFQIYNPPIGCANETSFLLHGTSYESGLQIAQEGFRLPVEKDQSGFLCNGSRSIADFEHLKLGGGLYFTNTASMARMFTADSSCFVICAVKHGKVWSVGDASEWQEPSDDAAEMYQMDAAKIRDKGYDSIRRRIRQKPSEHELVVYDPKAVLPLFVVAFDQVEGISVAKIGHADKVWAFANERRAEHGTTGQSISKCPQGHDLKLLPCEGTWICDDCKNSKDGPLGMSCEDCAYYICYSCRRRRHAETQSTTAQDSDPSCGCCVVTEKNFVGGLEVVRVSNGSAGGAQTGFMGVCLDSDGAVTVKWGEGTRDSHDVCHKSLKYHARNCICIKRWKEGDVLGLACDLDAMQIHLSVNGNFLPPTGCSFNLDRDAVSLGLFAALSSPTGTVRFNMGEVPFRHAPPSVDYEAFVELDAPTAAVIAAKERQTSSSVISLHHSPWLHAASSLGDAQRVAQLLKSSRDVDQRDDDGRTCLILAAMQGHVAVLQLLAGAGVDMEALDKCHLTALDYAADHEDKACETVLRQQGGRHSLVYASMKGMVPQVVARISQGANVDVRSKDNFTSLMIAIQKRHTVAAHVLIEPTAQAGALDVQNCWGMTALMLASQNGMLDVIRCLLLHGAKAQLTDDYGRTLVAFANDCSTVQCLLAAGVKLPEITDENKNTLLLSFARAGYVPFIKALLEGGADAAFRDATGNTSLMIALESGNNTAAHVLLAPTNEAGALDMQSNCGKKSALMIANGMGMMDMVERVKQLLHHHPLHSVTADSMVELANQEHMDVSDEEHIDAVPNAGSGAGCERSMESRLVVDNGLLHQDNFPTHSGVLSYQVRSLLELMYNEKAESISNEKARSMYQKLNAEITLVDPDHEMFNLVEAYLQNTRASNHVSQYELLDLFEIKLAGEDARFKPFEALDNRLLLWHGSRLLNFPSILSHGLKIHPPNGFQRISNMYGEGISFADVSSKAINFTYCSRAENEGLLLLCEVALGDMYESADLPNLPRGMPRGKLSLKGLGSSNPDPLKDMILPDGLRVPCGNLLPVHLTDPTNQSKFTSLYNNYTVYDAAQVKARFLIRFRMDWSNYAKQMC